MTADPALANLHLTPRQEAMLVRIANASPPEFNMREINPEFAMLVRERLVNVSTGFRLLTERGKQYVNYLATRTEEHPQS